MASVVHILGAAVSAAISVSRTPDAGDCPDANRLTARVERIIGEPLTESPTGARALVHVDFSRIGGTYQATVRLTGAREGERALRDEGSTCEALGDAVAVTTALLFDASESPTPGAESNDASRAGEPPRPLAWWLSGRFGAGLGLVGAPTWTAGAGIEASVAGVASFELGAALTGSRTNELGAGGVRVRLWYLELGACRSLTGEKVGLGPCLLFAGGQTAGTGESYPLTSSASLMWWAVGAGARAEVALGAGMRLGLRALAWMPTRKQSFSIAYVGRPYESSPVGGLAELALSVKAW